MALTLHWYCYNIKIKLRKNQLPGGEKCELSYPKPNFLESGGSKSNQTKPMHRGIMRKMTELCKMTTAKKNHQGQETLELVYSLHMFLSSWCCDDVNPDCLCFYSGQGGEIHRVHTDDVNRRRGRAGTVFSTESLSVQSVKTKKNTLQKKSQTCSGGFDS